MNSCRICLSTTKPLCPLFRYKLSGNYAEMLTAIADVKVVAKDGLPDKICTKCCTSLEKAYLLKTIAERSDKKLRALLLKNTVKTTKKIAFDSFTDVKSEIGSLVVKNEPKWDVEIEVLDVNKPVETVDGKDIVIANTVIRKVEGTNEDTKHEVLDNKIDLTWESLQSNTKLISTKQESTDQDQNEQEYFDDDIYQDDDDDDYVPPQEKQKKKSFKKPKLSDIKVFKDRVPVLSNVKVLKKIKSHISKDSKPFILKEIDTSEGRKSTIVTCYPILKNGTRGPAILLKRPKDANKGFSISGKPEARVIRPAKTVRVVRNIKPAPKQREKIVCPVCGILTFTLGNHMATHQEKKKYTCNQCPRSFVQKSNLQVHMKQHAGIKDHICEVCGAGFYSQKSLVRHNLIHKGDRPFACTLCSKRFIARCDLNRHMRIHSGYKPFKCGTCTMSFNAKHQLQNHERMHTGERPYSCQVCNVAFSYKVNLNNHVYKVHGINLKFKSIHTVTEEVLRREMGITNEARVAISQILPQLNDVPTPGAHETVHNTTDYSV